MANRYRLSSNVYDRNTDKVLPAKIFFLSVEGNLTEKEYFENISRYRDKLGMNIKVDVRVLKRASNDTMSAPKHVIELLEEYLDLRHNSLDKIEQELIEKLSEKYSDELIKRFIYEEESNDTVEYRDFISDLKLLNYDLEYRKFLTSFNNDIDEFAIIIDRDKKSHSIKNMSDCIKHCNINGYHCFISNPCFEFWLLMHLEDIEKTYKDKYNDIYENVKISNKHTFLSNEVSRIANHGKSCLKFEENYLHKIDWAILQSEKFPSSNSELISEIGSNVGELIKLMRMAKF